MEIGQYIDTIDDAVKCSILSLNDIEIDDYNGEGCNGYVFFGNHKVFRRRVAVKYYYYGENTHEEVSLINQISNPNILKVWDAHTIEDGWAYFITDEQRNGNIDNLLSNNRIDTNTSLHIIRGVLSGVGALHAEPNFLLHCDLKPANILIDNNMSPIIADFGSIKRMPENGTEIIASQHSPLYRPPESYDGGIYNYTSDIYQIGILFYQLLGGYLPYEATSYMTKAQLKDHLAIQDRYEQSKFEGNCLFDRAKKEKLLNLSTLPAYVDKRILQIIRKATKALPSERFTNIADFRLALHRIGSIPNWTTDGEVILCKSKNDSYQIIKNQQNQYVIEKKYSDNRWSKLRNSPPFDSKSQAIEYLQEVLLLFPRKREIKGKVKEMGLLRGE